MKQKVCSSLQVYVSVGNKKLLVLQNSGFENEENDQYLQILLNILSFD